MTILINFQLGDENGTWEVFYSAIHQVCSSHYTQQQLDAWAPIDLERGIWISKMRSIHPFVAVLENKIIGYSDLREDGLIDHFFVHGDYQRMGVGTLLMSEILKRSANKKRLHSEASRTAKLFFEKHGFLTLKIQTVKMREVLLSNNIMEQLNYL